MAKIELDNVFQVYSGRPGCMCGCRGRYWCATKHRKFADRDRGYAHADDEISDRQVKRIVNKLIRSPDTKMNNGHNDQRIFYLDTPTRSYVAYMKGVN